MEIETSASNLVSVSGTPLKSSGALIKYVHAERKVQIELSTEALFSGARSGKTNLALFCDKHPLPLLSTVLAQISKDRRDRIRAIVQGRFSDSHNHWQTGMSIPELASNEEAFNDCAEQWLQTCSKNGLLPATRNMVEKKAHIAITWRNSLKRGTALMQPEALVKHEASPLQCALYLALKISAKHAMGVPLMTTVRNEFHNIVIGFEQATRVKKPLKKLNIDSFDSGIRNLGFPWLPRTYDLSREIKPSE